MVGTNQPSDVLNYSKLVTCITYQQVILNISYFYIENCMLKNSKHRETQWILLITSTLVKILSIFINLIWSASFYAELIQQRRCDSEAAPICWQQRQQITMFRSRWTQLIIIITEKISSSIWRTILAPDGGSGDLIVLSEILMLSSGAVATSLGPADTQLLETSTEYLSIISSGSCDGSTNYL